MYGLLVAVIIAGLIIFWAIFSSTGMFSSYTYTLPVLPSGTAITLPFPVNAWNLNYGKWTNCTNLDIDVNAFCKCKGYSYAQSCWFAWSNSIRYKAPAASAPTCISKMQPGTGIGGALTKIMCAGQPSALPDLTITSASYNKTNQKVSATIKNQGNATASNFSVSYYDTTLGRVFGNAGDSSVSYLASGTSTTVTAQSYNVTRGVHAVKVTVDSRGTVAESNELNNLYYFNVTIS
jgi:hypothetical protein